MAKYIPLKKGEKFGRLVALGECERRKIGTQGAYCWYEKCVCTCGKGNELWIARTYLNTGHTRGCGCVRGLPKIKHGDAGSKLYEIYMTLKARCNNPNSYKYHWYGERGIKCLRKSYEDFKRDMRDSYYKHIEKYGENNTQIDRIDNNGNYCKENCRRVTIKENCRNRSSNHLVELNGVMMPLVEAYEKGNPSVSFNVFLSRIYTKKLDDNIDLALHGTKEEIREYLQLIK